MLTPVAIPMLFASPFTYWSSRNTRAYQPQVNSRNGITWNLPLLTEKTAMTAIGRYMTATTAR